MTRNEALNRQIKCEVALWVARHKAEEALRVFDLNKHRQACKEAKKAMNEILCEAAKVATHAQLKREIFE